MKKTLLIVFVCLIFALAACNKKTSKTVTNEDKTSSMNESTTKKEMPSTDGDAPYLYLEEDNLTLDLFDSYKLNVKLLNSTASISFESSDSSIVNVSEDGVLTAYKAGNASIVVSALDLTKVCNIVVQSSDTKPFISGLEDEYEIVKGETLDLSDLSVVYNNKEVENTSIYLSTSSDVISIENNIVTANEYGNAEVNISAMLNGVQIIEKNIKLSIEETGVIIYDLEDYKLDLYIGGEGYDLSQAIVYIDNKLVDQPELSFEVEDTEIVSIDGSKVVANKKGETKVTITYKSINTYDTSITFNVLKNTSAVDVNFLVKGDQKDLTKTETGNAVVDLSNKNIDLNKVNNVKALVYNQIDGKTSEVNVQFSVSGNDLTLINAPGGYNKYILEGSDIDYIIDGCVYVNGITTKEELLDYREKSSYILAYTVLLNDIDLEGITLPLGFNDHYGVFDGLGHTISNFYYGYGMNSTFYRYVNPDSVIKNIQFVNVVQNLEGASTETKGLFGDNVMGTVTNIMLTVRVINAPDEVENKGLLYFYSDERARVSDILINVTVDNSNAGVQWGTSYSGSPQVLKNITLISAREIDKASGYQATVNAREFLSLSDTAKIENFENWDSSWTIIENKDVYLRDYSDLMKNINISYSGETNVGKSLIFKDTSFVPLVYSLEKEVNGISITNNEVLIGSDATPGEKFTIKATSPVIDDFVKTYEFEVLIAMKVLDKPFYAQANKETGEASIDLTTLGITNTITSVKVNNTEIEFSFNNNILTLINAPYGDNVFLLGSSNENYLVNGCVYNRAISTVEEMEEYRAHDTTDYVVLLNDIDYKGAFVEPSDVYQQAKFDGRGHTIKNFTFSSSYAAKRVLGEFKNVNIIATFDGKNEDSYFVAGLCGYWLHGLIENVYFEVTIKNVTKGITGLVCQGTNNNAEGSRMRNVVVNVTSYENSAASAPVYVIDEHEGVEFQDVYISAPAENGPYLLIYGRVAGGTNYVKGDSEDNPGRVNYNNRIDWLLITYPNIMSWGGYWNIETDKVFLKPLW